MLKLRTIGALLFVGGVVYEIYSLYEIMRMQNEIIKSKDELVAVKDEHITFLKAENEILTMRLNAEFAP